MAAAEIIKYVDPDAAGTADGNSWANAYISLKAVADLNLNLPAQGGGDGSWMHVYCRSSAGTADTTPMLWNGWVTDAADNFVFIEAAAGDGTSASGWDTAKYRLSIHDPAGTYCIGVLDDNIYYDSIQIEMLSAVNGDCIIYQAGNTGLVFSNCRFRLGCDGAPLKTVYGWYPQAAGADCVFWNCIWERHPTHNVGNINRFIHGATGTGTLYNCTVCGCTYRAILCADANVDVYDSAVFGNTGIASDDFYCTVNLGTIDYCASDDNDGTNNVAEGVTGGTYWPNIFEDAANGDFRLKAGVALIGAGGKAGAGIFSDDIEGTIRGAAWDVGAYEWYEEESASASASASASGIEDHELVIADMTLALTFDGLALIQNHALAVADMAMALNLEALALTQNHALTIADIALALGFDAPALTQAQLLAVDGMAMGAVYGEPTLAQDHTLVVADMAHALNFDSPALIQASVLVVDGMACAVAFGEPTLMTGTVLVVSDMALGLVFGEPALTQDHSLSVEDMSLALVFDALNLTQAQVLAVDDMTLALLFDSISFTVPPVPVVPGVGTPCATWASRDRCGLRGPKIRYLGKKCGPVGPKPKRCED